MAAQTCFSCEKALGARPVLTFKAGSGNNKEDVYKCRECHNAKSLVFTLLSGNPELKEQWQKHQTAADDRKAFWIRAQNLYGSDLKVYVEETLEEAQSHTTRDAVHGDAEWLDEQEVRDHPRLKGKEAQVRNILDNGRTWFDTGRGVELYEVSFYQTKKSDTEEVSKTLKRKAQVETTVKPVKAPRVKKEKENAGEGGKPPEVREEVKFVALTEATTRKLDTMLTKMQKQKDALEKCLVSVRSDEMKDFVSKRQLSAAETAYAELVKAGDQIAACTRAGQCEKGFAPTATKEGNAKVTAAKTATAVLDDLLKMAADELKLEGAEGAEAAEAAK
eukprot:4002985-Pyramimonas_sp.AAC.1